MKKILAIILAVLTCLSMTACGGGSSEFNFADEWVIVSSVDVILRNEGNTERTTGTLGTEVIIDKDYNLYYTMDGSSYVVSSDKLKFKKYEPNTLHLKEGYERKVYTENFGYAKGNYDGRSSYNCYILDENVMYIQFSSDKTTGKGYYGSWYASSTDFTVVRKSALENFDNVSKIFSSDDSGFEVSLDGIVGEYNNTTFGQNSDIQGKSPFSLYENKNSLTIAKEGDNYTFTDGTGVKYTVEKIGLSTSWQGCISIELSNGTNSDEITVIETDENTITYRYSGGFCMLEKK